MPPSGIGFASAPSISVTAHNDSPVILAERVRLPWTPAAILWDMDGTVLDSLALDLEICNDLLRKHLAADVHVSRSFIRDHFALDVPMFWQRILEQVEADFGVASGSAFHPILAAYEAARTSASFAPCPGACEVLEEAKRRGIPLAIVSNNETAGVRSILRQSGVEPLFDVIVGNDHAEVKKKPAPDTYLLAAKMLRVDPARCAVVEDSLIGVESGKRAGAHVVGVATGGASFDTLADCGWADVVYVDFERSAPGAITDSTSRIATPLPLVDRWSAAFMSTSSDALELTWRNNDWEWLGSTLCDLLGRAIAPPADLRGADELVDVGLDSGTGPGVDIVATNGVNVSALTDAASMPKQGAGAAVRMLRGIAGAAHRDIRVTVLAHAAADVTWEAIFRAVGRAVHAR